MLDRIINSIKSHPEGMTTSELAISSSTSRSKVTDFLHNRSDFVFEGDKWFYNSVGNTEEQPDLIILIDLGNIHDCLQKVLPFVESRLCDVRAYADKMSNCYGISPKIDNEHVKVKVASDNHRNAADIEMVWDCATLPREYNTVCIVTRDLGFQTLVTKLRQDGRKVDIVHGWEEVREILLGS
jgi:uncharacterized LabA/DUF88 family protein